MKWVKHEINHCFRPELSELVNQGGAAAYGVYWGTVEFLGSIEERRATKSAIVNRAKLFTQRPQRFVDLLIELRILTENAGFFSIDWLNEQYQPVKSTVSEFVPVCSSLSESDSVCVSLSESVSSLSEFVPSLSESVPSSSVSNGNHCGESPRLDLDKNKNRNRVSKGKKVQPLKLTADKIEQYLSERWPLVDSLGVKALVEWAAHCETRKAGPLTELALTKILRRYGDNSTELKRDIDHSIENQYAGIYAPRAGGGKSATDWRRNSVLENERLLNEELNKERHNEQS